MSDKFAVIGANSFSGRAFVAHMRGLGHEVIEFYRPKDNFNRANDLAREIVLGGASHVVNFASLNMVSESWEHFPDYYNTNVTGVALLCKWFQTFKEWKGWNGRFIQVSTPEVYGETEGVIKEGAPFRPSTPYAVSRAAIDMHLRALHKAYGFRVLFTRSVNVYGPGQQIYRLIPKTVLSILRGQKLKLHGGGVSRRSWLHVDDVAEAIRLVALNGSEGEDYHIASDVYPTIRELVEMICDRMAVRFEDAVEIDDERPGKDSCYRLDDSKIWREFGWRNRVSFDNGLSQTINWFRENADKFAGQSLEYEHRS